MANGNGPRSWILTSREARKIDIASLGLPLKKIRAIITPVSSLNVQAKC